MSGQIIYFIYILDYQSRKTFTANYSSITTLLDISLEQTILTKKNKERLDWIIGDYPSALNTDYLLIIIEINSNFQDFLIFEVNNVGRKNQ